MYKLDTVTDPSDPHWVQLGVLQGSIGPCASTDFPNIFGRVAHEAVLSFIKSEMNEGKPSEIDVDTLNRLRSVELRLDRVLHDNANKEKSLKHIEQRLEKVLGDNDKKDREIFELRTKVRSLLDEPQGSTDSTQLIQRLSRIERKQTAMEEIAKKNDLSRCCSRIRITSTGEAARAQPSRLGLYIKFRASSQNDTLHIYKHETRNMYLYYLKQYNDWSIGDSVEGSHVGIQSGKVSVTKFCPEGYH